MAERLRRHADFWALAFIFLLILSITSPVVLTREYTAYLDNDVHYVSYHLFFDALLKGKLALWSFSQLNGMPIWPITEVHSMFDPLAWLVFPIGALLGASSFFCFTWFVFLAFYVMNMGIYALGRLKGFSVLEATAGTLATACSFLAVLIFKQANGLLLHAYLLPWVLVLFSLWQESGQDSLAVMLGILSGIQFAQYDIPLDLIGLVVVAIPFLLLKLGKKPSPRGLCWLALGALPFVVGLIVQVLEIRHLELVARLAEPSGNSGVWDMSFLGPLLVQLPHVDTVSNFFLPNRARNPIFAQVWDEMFFFPGCTTYSILVLCLASWIATKKKSISRPALFSIAATAIMTLLFLHFQNLLISIEHTPNPVFLRYRNWRFFYPYVSFGLSFVVMHGIRFVAEPPKMEGDHNRAAIYLALMALIIGSLYIVRGHAPHFAGLSPQFKPTLKPLLMAALATPVLLIRLVVRRSVMIKALFVGLLAIELVPSSIFFLRAALPKFTAMLAQREPRMGIRRRFLEIREGSFPVRDYAPFQKEGSAVWHIPAIMMDLEKNIPNGSYYANMNAIHFFYPAASHWFEPMSLYEAALSFSRDQLYEWGRAGKRFYSIASCAPAERHPGLACHDSYATATEAIKAPRLSDNEMQFHVTLPAPGYLYLAQTFDPDWRHNHNIEAANLIGSAVAVPAGESTVTLRYRPWGYILSALARFLAMIVFVVMAVRTISPRAARHFISSAPGPA